MARPGMRRALMVALFGVAGGTALVLGGLSGELFGRVPPGPAEISATPSQIIVIDAETLRLGNAIVHLSDLVAPARGEACAAGPDCGSRATAALADLVRDHEVTCQIQQHDNAGHPVARCEAGGQDINAALVQTGWARANSPELTAMQTDAKAHRRGMWIAG